MPRRKTRKEKQELPGEKEMLELIKKLLKELAEARPQPAIPEIRLPGSEEDAHADS